MKRYAIYGAGSLGTVLGAYITKNGGQIDLINRNRAHVDALRANGAIIKGTVNMTVPVTALTPDEMSGKYDVILLLTKQLLNREVVTFLSGFLAEDGVIVTVQGKGCFVANTARDNRAIQDKAEVALREAMAVAKASGVSKDTAEKILVEMFGQ